MPWRNTNCQTDLYCSITVLNKELNAPLTVRELLQVHIAADEVLEDEQKWLGSPIMRQRMLIRLSAVRYMRDPHRTHYWVYLDKLVKRWHKKFGKASFDALRLNQKRYLRRYLVKVKTIHRLATSGADYLPAIYPLLRPTGESYDGREYHQTKHAA